LKYDATYLGKTTTVFFTTCDLPENATKMFVQRVSISVMCLADILFQLTWQLLLLKQAVIDGIKNPDGSDIDLGFQLNAWLNQFGYPVLNVTRNGDGTATVTSRQFFSPVGQTPDTPSAYK
jgi:hypothetical protein